MQASPEDVPEKMEWWKQTIVYQIYPRSFQDSNGDGIGDIPGIISRLDHFNDIGVGAIWLSPFYSSPQLDFGYDISNFCDVDPMFGTLEDFDNMVKEAHKRGIKVIVDFVPGHSSHLHPWFDKSVKREDPYTDYYVWHDGKVGPDGKRTVPNNWLSVFGGPAWSWNEERGQYYYRPFIPEQPKLNFRCPQVVEEMKQALRFWLERDVDGIRVDAITPIMEAEDKSLDEPRNMDIDCLPDQYEYLDHVHTCNLPEGFQLVRGWRDVMEEFEKKDGRSRFMVIEVYEDCRNEYRKYGGLPFNMDLVDKLADAGLSGETVKELVDNEYSNLPSEAWPTFVLGNHDRHRFTSKFSPKYGDALNMLLLTLRGTPTTYYGEEIGLEDISVSYEDTQDPWGKNMGPDRYLTFSRDPCRSPMQWDASAHAGFTKSSVRPWLPVHPDYETVNVKVESEDESGVTPLQIYKSLATLRKEPTFVAGDLCYSLCNKDIFSYVRQHKKYKERYLIALNLGKKTSGGDFTSSPVDSKKGKVIISTGGVDKSLAKGQTVQLNNLRLAPGDGVVIKLN